MNKKIIILIALGLVITVSGIVIGVKANSNSKTSIPDTSVTTHAETEGTEQVLIVPTMESTPVIIETTTESTAVETEETTVETNPIVGCETPKPVIERGNGDYESLVTEVTNPAGGHVTSDEFIVLPNGANGAYPIAHREFEKIPDVSDSILADFTIYQEQGWFIGTFVRLEGTDKIVVTNDLGETLTFHLVGISWDTNGVVATNMVQDELVNRLIGREASIVIEPAEKYENDDGTYNAYAWCVYNATGFHISSLNELMLIEGLAEPNLSTVNTRYNNWFIQYPELYFD